MPLKKYLVDRPHAETSRCRGDGVGVAQIHRRSRISAASTSRVLLPPQYAAATEPCAGRGHFWFLWQILLVLKHGLDSQEGTNHRWSERRHFRAGLVLRRVELEKVGHGEGRGLRHRLSSPLLVLGGLAWERVELGARVSTTGRLAPADDTDLAALLPGASRSA